MGRALGSRLIQRCKRHVTFFMSAKKWKRILTDAPMGGEALNPTATTSQGALLALLSIVLVVGGVMLAPVLPLMVAHYAPTNEGAEAKVLIAMGLPGLMVGLFANHLGIFCDKYGRKTVLLLALGIYSFAGMYPIFVPDNLDIFVASRAVLGIAEAAVVVSSSAMLGDYFSGAERQKWFIRQFIVGGVAAIILVVAGGFLGSIAWNAPFYMYGLFLLAIPLVMFMLFEPQKSPEEPIVEKFPWDKVRSIYIFAFFAGIVAIVVPIQLAFILTERGIVDPATIGLTNMVNSIAMLSGTILFGFRKDANFKMNLSGGLIFTAMGILLIGLVDSYPVTVVGAFLAGLGAGFLMPTMLTEVMRHLPFEWRGRGNGRYNAAFFLGAFSSPLVVVAAANATGGLPNGFGVLGLFCIILAVFVIVLLKSRVGMKGIDD